MAAFTSKASGDWSAAGQTTWNEVGVPIAGDTVTIAATHVITVDDVSRACAAVTLNGTLKASRTSSCKLTHSATITVNSTGNLDWGTEASPIPAAYTASLSQTSNFTAVILNAASRGGVLTVRGDDSRNSWTTLITAASTSVYGVVSDATGWQIGDELLFVPASSTNINANHIETRTLAAGYTPGSTTLVLSSYCTNTHIAGGRVYNMTRNVQIGPTTGVADGMVFNFDANVNIPLSCYVRYAKLTNMCSGGSSAVFRYGTTNLDTVTKQTTGRILDSIDHCVFHISGNGAFPTFGGNSGADLTVNHCCFYYPLGDWVLSPLQLTEFNDCTFAVVVGSIMGFYNQSGRFGLVANRCWFSGAAQYGSYFMSGPLDGLGVTLTDCIFSGVWREMFGGGTGGQVTDNGSDWGYTYGIFVSFKMLSNLSQPGGYTDFTSTGGKFNTTHTDTFDKLGFTGNTPASLARLWNKNGDISIQEYYKPQCRFSRDTTTATRSTSSLKAGKTTADDLPQSYTFQVLAKSGESLLIRGYMRKNAAYGSSTRPTLTVSGLGISPVSVTMTDVTDTWEMFDLPFSQSSGTDGLLDVAFTIQSSSATAVAYLSGVSIAPFVTRCRHYGYLFDETSPTRTADFYKVVDESTALSYTGIAINNTTKEISFSAGTADSAQKFYDHSRYWCVADLSRDIPFVRAGTLFDLKSNWKVVDPYYTNTVTWGTGTIKLSTTGAKTLSLSGATVQMAATGDYNLSASTLSGTINFTTDTGLRVVSVAVPAGTSYTTEGANVTVTVASAALTIAANVSLLGAEIRVYDLDGAGNSLGTELTGTESCPTATFDYSGTGGNVVWIQILKSGYKEFGQQFTLPATSSTFTATLNVDSNL